LNTPREPCGRMRNYRLSRARWQEPEAHMALKRASRLLVHKLVLIQEAPDAYVIEIWMYEFRESLFHESTCLR
jgi:hypothetical protein